MAVGGPGDGEGVLVSDTGGLPSNKECMLFLWERSRFVADFGPKRLGAPANRCTLALLGVIASG